MRLRLVRDEDWGWLLMRGPIVVCQLQHLSRGFSVRALVNPRSRLGLPSTRGLKHPPAK